MKRIFIGCLVALLISGTGAYAQSKYAVIDMQRAFTEYYKTKDAEANLKEKMDRIQKDRKDMVDDYQKMVDEANKLKQDIDDKTLSDATRQQKQAALNAKVQDVQAEQRKIQETMDLRGKEFEEKSRKMRGDIIEEIVAKVKEIGEKEKYTMIIDKAAPSMNGTPVLLYSEGLKDLTDDVVKIMNSTKPAATAAPATPAPKP